MKTGRRLMACFIVAAAAAAAAAQTMVINDPTSKATSGKMTAAEKQIFERDALPRVKKEISSDVCEGNAEVAGVVRGAFSRPGARQSLIFYQYCQTGNGFGVVGLVLIEGDQVAGNFTADAGWTIDIAKVDDVNRNGLAEFVLSYSGGMHQGQGGVGADIVEFKDGVPTGIGFYKASSFNESDVSMAWKLTAKPGPKPVFYKQKFTSKDDTHFKALGSPVAAKLEKPYAKFEAVK